MAVVISEIVTETLLTTPAEVAGAPTTAGGGLTEEAMDVVVRRAVERTVEVLRREWDL